MAKLVEIKKYVAKCMDYKPNVQPNFSNRVSHEWALTINIRNRPTQVYDALKQAYIGTIDP